MDRQTRLFETDDEFSIISSLASNYLTEEYYKIEYKSAKNGFPRDFWKTYSAYANTNAGLIILGIAETKKGLVVEGLADRTIENYKKQFWDECNNRNTVSANLLCNDDVREIEIEGKKVLVFRIPFADRTKRPVFLTRNPFGNTYKRNHEGDYRCTDEEVKRMIADSNGELRRDGLILENFSTGDFDPASVRQFRQLLISSKPDHPWNSLSDTELYQKIGAYKIDRKTGQEGITLAGLLMFGKSDSISDQDALPDFFPDFREKLSKDENIRWTDRIIPDGTWEHNLLQFYLRVWPKISSTLPKPFLLNEDMRVDDSPAHIALREAFVNALVHTDYSLSGNIIVELDTEQFVFSNPGTLLVSLAQYYEGGISECRNPALQKMFMLIGRAEKAGSGADKIISGWKSAHWRRPYLELESQPDRVKLTLPMFDILPDKVLNELHQRFGNLKELSPDELTILAFSHIEGSISNNRLQYILDVHSSDITALLKNLVIKGYLERNNSGRWSLYRIPDIKPADTTEKIDTSARKVDTSARKVDTSARKVDTSSQKVDTSSQKVDTSSRKVDTSSQKVDTSSQKVDTSSQKVDTSSQKVDTSSQKVDTSSRKVDTSNQKVNTSNDEIAKKHYKRNDLEMMIMIACKNQHIKMDAIAIKVERSADYLKNKVVPEMMKDGKLEKLYPYTHNHPEQAYKTTEEYAREL